MAFGRFERKIITAIAAAALMPLFGALILGLEALRAAYGVGVNQQVEEQLERGLLLYRQHLSELRDDAERTASSIANDVSLNHALTQHTADLTTEQAALSGALETLMARYENLSRLDVLRDGHVIAFEQRAQKNDEPLRLLALERELATLHDVKLRVTIGAPERAFGDYQKAGELTELFRTLKKSSDYVSAFYLAVYIAMLLSVIVVALAVGIMLSRRVTRRVSLLAEATEKLGAGDLSVRVPVDDDDEVGDLTRAFNTMVQDMRDSRERIDYLSRISAWQEFARRLAHEIKNPLTPIQLAVQEAHRSYRGEDERHRRMLEDMRAIVEEEIATLRRLVGEFSEFARLPEVHKAPEDLGVFVRDALDNPFRADEQEGEKPVQIEVETDAVPIPVMIDTMLLKRCLDNLVQNAVQAIRGSDRPSGRVRVCVKRGPAEAWIEVRDDGPGVPVATRERVFDPYYTTKAEGTGLGLAIVKKIVLEHGGEISCRQAPEGGACFRISLPSRAPGRVVGSGRP